MKSAIVGGVDLCNKSQLVQYLKREGLWAKKGLGQNFLVDRVALEKIVEAAELKPSDTVLEIGPGLGTLTQELILRAGRVLAVEKDERLAQLLNCSIVKLLGGKNSNLAIQQFSNDKLKIVMGDVLDFKTQEIINTKPYKIIANIPYYITSKILKKFLSTENKPELIVLLVQKEVAERICAKPGNLSVLAVSVQYYGEPEIVGIVKRDSFFPTPEVDSAIIKIRTKNTEYSESDEKDFFKIVKAGFNARRKTLLNNLKSGTQLDSGQIIEILDTMKLEKNIRAQELSLEQWIFLAYELNMKIGKKTII